MDEQAADAGRPPGLTGSDGWATAGPSEPVGPLCPWCSAPLLDAAAERCGACGAQLTGAPDAPILGVTAVARLDALVKSQQALGSLEDALQSPLGWAADAWETAPRPTHAAQGTQ